ncbi:MAG TPA: pyruvate synthase subunit PorB [Candidatus Brocadiia bacterium]|nr:pyruvate synthase subunit beta [Planctomycetota bacterium]
MSVVATQVATKGLRLQDLAKQEELLASGHSACAGCAGTNIIRQVLLATGRDVVFSTATGCMEVVTTIYPNTAWRVPFIHSAFENAAATISGVEAAYRVLRDRGKIKKDINFVAFGGDGGTYDIGFQALSGALERGHKFIYICYDNEAYMNTGTQRSSATPLGASTTTAPAGKVSPGKTQHRKDMTAVVAAHRIPYVAQAAPHNYRDLISKVKKATEVDGPAFINVLSTCPRGWQTKTEDGMELTRLAVETCYWPLFEIDHGKLKINYKPKEKKPIVEWLKIQGRFKHLFKPENEHIIKELQEETDRRWDELLRKEAAGLPYI